MAIEILKKHGVFLEPSEFTTDIVKSYEDPLCDFSMHITILFCFNVKIYFYILMLDAANERTLLIFLSLPVLFPPRPSRAFKGNTIPNVTMLSKKLVRRFPVSLLLKICNNNLIIVCFFVFIRMALT